MPETKDSRSKDTVSASSREWVRKTKGRCAWPVGEIELRRAREGKNREGKKTS